MALADKDRIFQNLYGRQPWNLAAARMRVQLFRPRCSLQRKASPWERVAQVVARKVLRAVMEIPAARVTQVRSARLCAPPAAAAALAEQPRV